MIKRGREVGNGKHTNRTESKTKQNQNKNIDDEMKEKQFMITQTVGDHNINNKDENASQGFEYLSLN